MENPLLLMFLIGLLLGLMFGMYIGSKKFRATINKMIKGKDHDEDDEDGEDETREDYETRNKHYHDGKYRGDRIR